MLTFHNQGLRDLTEYLLGKVPYFGIQARLYTNDDDFDHNSQYFDFDEPEIPDYHPIALIGSSWVGSVTNGVSFYVHDEITWDFGPNDGTTVIYGWWVCEPQKMHAIWSAKFAIPYVVPAVPSDYSLSVMFSQQENSCND